MRPPKRRRCSRRPRFHLATATSRRRSRSCATRSNSIRRPPAPCGRYSPPRSTPVGTTISSLVPPATTRGGGQGSSLTRARRRATLGAVERVFAVRAAAGNVTAGRAHMHDRAPRARGSLGGAPTRAGSTACRASSSGGSAMSSTAISNTPISNVGFDWVVAAAGRRERRGAVDPGRAAAAARCASNSCANGGAALPCSSI